MEETQDDAFLRSQDDGAKTGGGELQHLRGRMGRWRSRHFGVINKPAGTGSRPHRHPNEQFIFVQQGSLQAMIDGERKTVGAGGIIHIPANSLHSMVATDDEDVIFIVAKDTTWQIEGVAEDDSSYGAYIGEGADASVASRFREIAEQGPGSSGD